MTIDRLVNWFLAGCIALAAGMFVGAMIKPIEAQWDAQANHTYELHYRCDARECVFVGGMLAL